MRPIPAVLSIAGSDSGGGAGIEADLKAFARCGVHGMCAITAVTAQNTVAVRAIHELPPEVIVEQVRAVAEDIGVDAVKVGMLGSSRTIEAVAGALNFVRDAPIVLDPVMISESGATLLEPAARDALRELLLPRSTVITPNVPEALALTGSAGARPAVDLAQELRKLGCGAVVVTGGHREGAIDVYCDAGGCVTIPGELYADGAAHGSGCTHSSTLAAHLALGFDPLEAARAAKRVASRAVRDGLRGIGAGSGPVDVFGLGRAAARGDGAAHQATRHLT